MIVNYFVYLLSQSTFMQMNFLDLKYNMWYTKSLKIGQENLSNRLEKKREGYTE